MLCNKRQTKKVMEDRLLFKFLKNEASAKEVREVLDWLDESPANREYLNALDEADFALQSGKRNSAGKDWNPRRRNARR